MPSSSSESMPDALVAIQRELELRDVVANAHATFHVKPSLASADKLAQALEQWRNYAASIAS